MATATVLLFTLTLAGCGSSEPEGAANAQAGTKTKAQTSRPDMVAAVSSARGGTSNVELRFNIPERPVIGQPTTIQLSLIPGVELERLLARFQVPEGVELVSGAETPRFDRPTPGAEITHTLTVIPKADGIFNITAVVLADSATDSVARTFSIPFIAGAGLPEAPPAPAARPNASN